MHRHRRIHHIYSCTYMQEDEEMAARCETVLNTTMAEIFEGIISSSRNVSHMCMSTLLFEFLELGLIAPIQLARRGRSRHTTARSGPCAQ